MDLKVIQEEVETETRDSYSECHLEMILLQHPTKLALASPRHLRIHLLMPTKIEVERAKLEGPQDPDQLES